MQKEEHCFDLPEQMNYTLYYPQQVQDLPLLVFLHGAGERGKNLEHLDRHGVPKLLKHGKEYNAVILCPQCPAHFVWDNVVQPLKELIDRIAARFAIKPDRICLTGCSMGGFGTWSMGLCYPDYFACIAPVSGGGMSWRAPNLRTTPVLAYHGQEDTSVPIIYSQLMVDAVNAAGGNAKLVSLPGMGHNDGIGYAYEQTDLIDWILLQRRTDFTHTPEILEHMF